MGIVLRAESGMHCEEEKRNEEYRENNFRREFIQNFLEVVGRNCSDWRGEQETSVSYQCEKHSLKSDYWFLSLTLSQSISNGRIDDNNLIVHHTHTWYITQRIVADLLKCEFLVQLWAATVINM